MYSVWIYCEKEVIEEEVKTKLLPFNPLVLDWEENKKEMKKSDEFTVSSTPIFLIGNEK